MRSCCCTPRAISCLFLAKASSSPAREKQSQGENHLAAGFAPDTYGIGYHNSRGVKYASMDDFFNLYRHGYVRVALGTPRVRIGDPRANAAATLALMRQAARRKAIVAVFPELGLAAYSCADLFHQQAPLSEAQAALASLVARSRSPPPAP